MLATVLVAALSLSAGQSATLGALQLVPPLLLSDFGFQEEQKAQEPEPHPEAANVSANPSPGVGWRIAGTTGMAILGALPGLLIIDVARHPPFWLEHGTPPQPNLGAPIAVTIVGAVISGIIGYAIGEQADEGSEGAKSLIKGLDFLAVVIGTPVVVGAVQ